MHYMLTLHASLLLVKVLCATALNPTETYCNIANRRSSHSYFFIGEYLSSFVLLQNGKGSPFQKLSNTSKLIKFHGEAQ